MNLVTMTSIFQRENQSQKGIAVVGDIMLDRYIYGDVYRISPEAPVPIVDAKKSEDKLGGAANVAYNIKSLGGNPLLIGVLGNDENSHILERIFDSLEIRKSGLVYDGKRKTTTKTRIMADDKHLLRIDEENREGIDAEKQRLMMGFLEGNKSNFDYIVIADYNKGVITDVFLYFLEKFARENGKRILVDPKWDNFFEYRQSFLFKPNRKDFETAMGTIIDKKDALKEKIGDLISRGHQNILLTLGEEGMILFESPEKRDAIITEIDTHAQHVSDVSGAGDTVIATIAVCLNNGMDLNDAVKVSNLAAGIVVGEPGIVAIDRGRLERAVRNFVEAAYLDNKTM